MSFLEKLRLNKMNKKKIINNKGQSLVEVVVALTILAIVFIGIVTLAANTIKLMLSSRQKMQAVAIAQQQLELEKSNTGNSCTARTVPSNPVIPSQTIDGTAYTITKSLASSANYPNAVLVTITVSWPVQSQTMSLTVRELVNTL